MLPKKNIPNSCADFTFRATRNCRIFIFAVIGAAAAFLPAKSHASELNIPPDAHLAIDLMYQGKPQEAIEVAHKLEAAQPDHPLGFLIEADILWWNIYCKWSERKYNTIDAWSHTRPPDADDVAELALADKVSSLAEAGIAKADTAEMELYAGLGYASRARILGLRYEKIPVARAGVESRKHLLRCLELNPNMADAYLGLGLYNYYVDTLSAMAKVLRFFMGIPGGDKREGLRQLEIASTKGDLAQMEARFNMAKSLRNYDFDYARAEQAAEPLLNQHPDNCIFLLLAGDIEQKLGHNSAAAEKFQAVASSSWPASPCADRARGLAREALATLNTAAPLAPQISGNVLSRPVHLTSAAVSYGAAFRVDLPLSR
jgi:tetratricopeptide (TPR) repeat protein